MSVSYYYCSNCKSFFKKECPDNISCKSIEVCKKCGSALKTLNNKAGQVWNGNARKS